MEHLPRVTGILKDAGLIDTTWFTAGACERGSAVHLACQYLDEGDLDISSLDPQLEGYVRAYCAWKHDSNITGIQWIEMPMQDPLGMYRGTPDRVLITRPRMLADLKTGQYHPSHKWQTAAYVNCLQDPYSYSRIGVYLTKDGKYSVREFPKTEYRDDLNIFMAALTIVQAKKRNGLL